MPTYALFLPEHWRRIRTNNSIEQYRLLLVCGLSYPLFYYYLSQIIYNG